jgi:UDP-2,3-diacylglucosamine hydrolase
MQKDPCYKIDLFKKIIQKRLSYLKDEPLDIVVEGHFHQNLSFELYEFEYINLSSFACNSKYFIVQSNRAQFNLQEISL